MAGASSAKYLTDAEFGAWHGFLETHTRVLRELDQRLKADCGISVSEFDVLITLFNSPDRQLRMTDLANAITLTPAGLTHMANRLEREGLVERRTDPKDRRSSFLHLTDHGLARLDDARRGHNEVIRRRFLGPLSAAQLRQLTSAWRAIRHADGGE
jgi:DNA-binding MarR family transcriptional regulator